MSINLQTGTNRIHKHTHKINTVRTKKNKKENKLTGSNYCR
jgi:hypothetical protein